MTNERRLSRSASLCSRSRFTCNSSYRRLFIGTRALLRSYEKMKQGQSRQRRVSTPVSFLGFLVFFVPSPVARRPSPVSGSILELCVELGVLRIERHLPPV